VERHCEMCGDGVEGDLDAVCASASAREEGGRRGEAEEFLGMRK
jgi:hypothetical protein